MRLSPFGKLLTIAWMSNCHAQVVSFRDLNRVYSGDPSWPQVMVGGQARSATFQCREIDPGTAPAAFSNLPTTLGLSYNSLGFAANQTSALGNLVVLSGTARVADHADTVMVTWATAANYPEFAASDPTGYCHPVTATLYEVKTSNTGDVTLLQLERSTVHVHVPWRPMTLPDGSPYPYNGYAFQTSIPFSAKVRVPDQCLISISFNTQNSGEAPLGIAGPYNQLNLALGTSSPKVGADVNVNEVFWVKNGQWYYPARNWGGFGSPMIKLGTRDTAPVQSLLTPEAPLHAGSYHIEATVNPEGTVAGAIMEVAKKSIQLETSGLTKSIADPDPFITVTNQSPGLAVSIRYGDSSTPPENPGSHPFTIAVTDSDHTGSLSGVFRLTGITYEQWRQLESPLVGAGGEDPDSDGQANWLEYAVGGNPLGFSQALRLDSSADGFKIGFMKRREMPDVSLILEYSTDLNTWLPLDTVTETADDLWESASATSNLPKAYFRLKVNVD